MEILVTIMQEIHGVLGNVKAEELRSAAAIFSKDRRVFVDGEGRSGLMAKGFAMRLMHLGYTVYVIGETITPAIKEGDLLVCVSGSGCSSSVVGNALKAHEKNIEILAFTSKEASPLGEIASVLVLVPGTIRSEQGESRTSIQLLSSLFDQSIHIVLDALCLMISRQDNVSNETATKTHW